MNGKIKDYEHFNILILPAMEKVFAKIRNLRYRYLPSQMTLLPIETVQYDHWLIREVLHNCIAHQNFECGRRNY